MPPLIQVLESPPIDESWWELRGKTIECITFIATSVGKEVFSADVAKVLELFRIVREALKEGDAHGIYLWAGYARLAEVLEEDFAPYTEDVMPHILEILNKPPRIHFLEPGMFHN